MNDPLPDHSTSAASNAAFFEQLQAPEALAQLERQLILGDKPGAFQLAKTIINAAHVDTLNVGTSLDEASVRMVIDQVLLQTETRIAANASRQSLQDYFRSLDSFNRSPYRILAGDFGEHDLTEVFIPIPVRLVGLTHNTVEAHEALSDLERSGRPILIQGSPGGGKSTLLRMLAIQAWDKPGAIGLQTPHLPMLVRLQCLGYGSGSVDQRLWRAVEQAKDLTLSGTPPPVNFLSDWSAMMKAPWLLLLDGWDEIHPTHSAEVAEWLRVVLGGVAGVTLRVVLTTRPTQSIPKDLESRFVQFNLEPLDQEQQKNLAERWVGAETPDFLTWFRRVVPAPLAGTPLLLTIAAFVFKRGDKSALPARRVGLYRQFMEIWLREMWERGGETQIDEDVKPFIDLALEQLARAMTVGTEGNVANISSLTTLIAPILSPLVSKSVDALCASSAGGKEGLARRLIRALGARSGVFQCFGDTCVWMHPTFREYFTARAYARAPSAGGIAPESAEAQKLLAQWGDDRWRQVLLMLLALWSNNEDHEGVLEQNHDLDELVLRLADSNPPRSIIFAGRAVAQGARIGSKADVALVERLCEVAKGAALENSCNRLLTHVDKLLGSQVQDLLRRRLREPLLQKPLETLARSFVALADVLSNDTTKSHQTKYQTSLCMDMAGYEFWDALLEIASNEQLDVAVRLQAIHHLPAKYANHLLPLLQKLSEATTDWEYRDGYIAFQMARLGGIQFLEGMIARWKELTSSMRLRLPLSVTDPVALAQWANNPALARDLRIAAQLRLLQLAAKRPIASGLEAAAREEQAAAISALRQLLPKRSDNNVAPENPHFFCFDDTLELVVTTLRDLRLPPDLANIARDRTIATELSQKCLAALAKLEKLDLLLEVVFDLRASGDTRECAACVLAECPTLTFPDHRTISDRLMAFLNKRLRARQGNHALLLARAKLFAVRDERDKSSADLNAIISDLDRIRQAFLLRGRSNRLDGWAVFAIGDLDTALRIKPGEADVLLERALAHHGLNQAGDAVKDFEAIENYRFTYSAGVPLYADSLRQVGKVPQAIDILDDYLRIEKVDATGWAVRGRCDADVLLPDELDYAIQCFSRALEIDPDYLWGRQQRVVCYHRVGKVEAALQDQNRVCELLPNDPSALGYRAQLATRAGAFTQAESDISRLSELSILPAVKHFLAALLAVAQGRLEAARPLSEQACESMQLELPVTAERSNELRGLLILICLLANRSGQVTEHLELLLQRDDARVYLRDSLLPDLADVLVVKGPNGKIQNVYDRLKAVLYPNAPAAAPRSSAQASVSRPRRVRDVDYPCPMYCRKSSIQGLEAEIEEAEAVLQGRTSRRSLVLLGIDGGDDPLFGQCNFPQETGDEHDLKFCEKTRTLLAENLRTLVRDFRVQEILFKDKLLMARFNSTAAEQGLPVKCVLIDHAG